ncbi:hypothetical protein LX32DRAFT_635394 [Colletotrichum zoysiae]|uniref:Uncharacterized protein n=1 Tax=Colletotrichum zoysiae TaxID=1216348 RepID=A0AAD9HQP8_9PEZI|nr:hypothetical protein LX32DRAFT_635394 [Colletotrichum zoysiae]
MKVLTLLYVLVTIPLASAARHTVRVCRCTYSNGQTYEADTRSACGMVGGRMRSLYCATEHDEDDWKTTKCLYDGACWRTT